jgi:pyruvate,orthophosphate dikinase
VTGAGTVEIDVQARELRVNGIVLGEGDQLAIDGTTGNVTTDDVPLIEPEVSPELTTVLQWADELRTLAVRTNADTPADAAKAVELGAQGIGLCRTEHMFFGEERNELMAAMILADSREERAEVLAQLEPLQRSDFDQIYAAMDGRPVTIRLLDPPLHEFLPHAHDLERELDRVRVTGPDEDIARLEHTLERVRSLEEVNPMLGTRGCRLGILFPELYEMQVRAILTAARAAGTCAEIMVPLVDYERELQLLRGLVDRVAAERGMTPGDDYRVGTMIELPRACFLADRIAEHADFFSFGTNDLTQTGLGFSRDDIEKRILARYIDLAIFDRSPFETIDTPGVGQMLRMGAWLGRTKKPTLELGVCGEHGGDPDSIDFFHHSGIDYVSCSPYRVPIARIAAAQAAVRATQ